MVRPGPDGWDGRKRRATRARQATGVRRARLSRVRGAEWPRFALRLPGLRQAASGQTRTMARPILVPSHPLNSSSRLPLIAVRRSRASLVSSALTCRTGASSLAATVPVAPSSLCESGAPRVELCDPLFLLLPTTPASDKHPACSSRPSLAHSPFFFSSGRFLLSLPLLLLSSSSSSLSSPSPSSSLPPCFALALHTTPLPSHPHPCIGNIKHCH